MHLTTEHHLKITLDATPKLLNALTMGPEAVRLLSQIGETMSELVKLQEETRAALDRLKQRIAEDFDNLRTKIEEGTIKPEELDAFRTSIIGDIDSIDPDPNFPAAPEPTPVEPNPNDADLPTDEDGTPLVV